MQVTVRRSLLVCSLEVNDPLFCVARKMINLTNKCLLQPNNQKHMLLVNFHKLHFKIFQNYMSNNFKLNVWNQQDCVYVGDLAAFSVGAEKRGVNCKRWRRQSAENGPCNGPVHAELRLQQVDLGRHQVSKLDSFPQNMTIWVLMMSVGVRVSVLVKRTILYSI